MKRRYIIALLLLLVPALFSCGDMTEERPMGPTYQLITVAPTETTLKRSETVTFSAVGGTGTYFWEVSQEDIGTIDADGVFTATNDGEATIICRDTENLLGYAKVVVAANIVTITPDAPSIGHNSTITFMVTGGTT